MSHEVFAGTIKVARRRSLQRDLQQLHCELSLPLSAEPRPEVLMLLRKPTRIELKPEDKEVSSD